MMVDNPNLQPAIDDAFQALLGQLEKHKAMAVPAMIAALAQFAADVGAIDTLEGSFRRALPMLAEIKALRQAEAN